MKFCVAAILLMAPIAAPAIAQSVEPARTIGTETARDASSEKTRAIRTLIAEAPRSIRKFAFVTDNPLDVAGALWTEIDFQMVEPGTGRIVAEVAAKCFKHGAEYYFERGELIFVYESRYFAGKCVQQPITRNFKNFPAWERLTVIEDEAVTFSRAGGTGVPAPGTSLAGLVADGERLRALLPK